MLSSSHLLQFTLKASYENITKVIVLSFITTSHFLGAMNTDILGLSEKVQIFRDQPVYFSPSSCLFFDSLSRLSEK